MSKGRTTTEYDIEVFKTGRHLDSQGRTRTWTVEDMRTIERLYNEERAQDVPLVKGHPKTDDPAEGWVKALRFDARTKTLHARVYALRPEFIDDIRQMRYRYISPSFYPDLRLKHIGFLGAVASAVKGMADPQFSEGETTDESILVLSFEETTKLKATMDEKQFQELLDAIKSQGTKLDTIVEAVTKLVETSEESPEKKPEDKTSDSGEDAPEFSELNKRLVTLEAENARMRADRQTADFSAFLSDLVASGKMLPSEKTGHLRTMEVLAASPAEFTEGEGATAKKVSAIENYKSILSAREKAHDFKEFATSDRAGTSQKDEAVELGLEMAKLARS